MTPPDSARNAPLAEMDPGRDIPGAQALRRGLSLLDAVAEAERPLRFTDLCARTGLAKPTAHRMLAVLMEAGLLRLAEDDQTYRLGARLFAMAHKVWDQFDLRGAAAPELERLRDLTGETVRLAMMEADHVLYVDQRDGRQPVRVGGGVGARVAPHASGAGKAILAHLDPLERQRRLGGLALPRLAPHTITERRALAAELDLVRGRGYAISLEEQSEGVASVAAPVLDAQGSAMGAVAIVMPAYRTAPDALHGLGRDVMEAARRISGNAGQSAMSITIGPRPLGPDRADVACVLPSSCFLGEGPHWEAGSGLLWWVDILAPAIHAGDPANGSMRSWPMPELVSAIVPRAGGGFLIATQSGLKGWHPEGDVVETLAAPEHDRPGNRMNDGKCDPRGRFLVGSLAINTAPGRGTLWRMDPDRRCTALDQGFTVSNGIGWSPDGSTLYFTDSAARRIWAYDYNLRTGAVANRRPFVTLPEGTGTPDGLAVDEAGSVWSAQWDGWCVTRYAPDGSVERVVNLPVPRPTSCAFGGPDGDTLFVTSARIRLSARQLAEAPLSGAVFAVRAGVRGLQVGQFGG